VDSQYAVHATNVAELIGVCQVLAVPGYQKIAAMNRGERKMKGVAHWISRHDFVRYVCLHNVEDRLGDG